MSAPGITQETRDQVLARLPAYRRPDWREDPETVLHRSLEHLHGLASCLTVLGRADRVSEVQDQLIDDALPMLGYVMMQIAGDAIRAQDEISDAFGLWAQARAGSKQ